MADPGIKVQQETVVKKSIIDPARELDPQFHVDEKGRVISEQEIIERRRREIELKREAQEKKDRRARWEGKAPGEILCMELERIRPGTVKDDTFSCHPRGDDSIDVHLHGRVFRVLPHVVVHSERSATWHITAKGCLDRLKTAAVRPDVPRAVKQAEVYEEQADMIRELAKGAGILDEPDLQRDLAQVAGLGESAIRWKSEVNCLFLYTRRRLQEMRHECQNSAQPQQKRRAAKAAKAEGAEKPQPKRRRPKAGPRPKANSPESPGGEDSRTTSPS